VHARANKAQGYNEGILLTADRIDKIEEWMKAKIIDTKHNLQG
jgi:hypothetical protein